MCSVWRDSVRPKSYFLVFIWFFFIPSRSQSGAGPRVSFCTRVRFLLTAKMRGRVLQSLMNKLWICGVGRLLHLANIYCMNVVEIKKGRLTSHLALLKHKSLLLVDNC